MKKSHIKLRIIQILLITIIAVESAIGIVWNSLRYMVDFSKHESLGILLDKMYDIHLLGIIPTLFAMLCLPAIYHRITMEQYKILITNESMYIDDFNNTMLIFKELNRNKR